MLPGRYLAAMGLSLLLAMPVVAQTTKSSNPPAAAAPSPAEKATGKSEQAGGLIDINSASAEELDKLPGVGPVRA